jgi:hypothetical protein
MRAAPIAQRSPPQPASHPDWSQLLVDAVNTPGVIAGAYSRFWNYSIGNQLLAMFQCALRKIEPGPIHTFLGWRDLGRSVKKGEKALTLCMPVRVRRRRRGEVESSPPDGGQPSRDEESRDEPWDPAAPTITRFVHRPRWFVLGQTEGKDYVPAELRAWSEARALGSLKIDRVEFRHTDGNAQGYALGRQVAVSPIAFMPARTLLHELAHVVLGHTEELQRLIDDDSATPRHLREVEAECVALICCASLDLGGEAFSRGYVQHWLNGQAIPERSAQKVFRAADQILRAGRQSEDSGTDPSTPA